MWGQRYFYEVFASNDDTCSHIKKGCLLLWFRKGIENVRIRHTTQSTHISHPFSNALKPPTNPITPTLSHLSRLPRRLIRNPLTAHLTLNPTRLAPRRARRALRLLGLLLALRVRFLLFALGNGFLTRCGSGFGTLGAAVFD